MLPDSGEKMTNQSKTSQSADGWHRGLVSAVKILSFLTGLCAVVAGGAALFDVIDWVTLDVLFLAWSGLHVFILGLLTLIVTFFAPDHTNPHTKLHIVVSNVGLVVAAMSRRVYNDYPDAHIDDAHHCRTVTDCSLTTDMTVAEARSVQIDIMFVSVWATTLLFLGVYLLIPNGHMRALRQRFGAKNKEDATDPERQDLVRGTGSCAVQSDLGSFGSANNAW